MVCIRLVAFRAVTKGGIVIALHCKNRAKLMQLNHDVYIEKFIQTFSIIYWIVTTTTDPLLLPIGSPLMLVKSRYFGFFSSLALRAAISSNLIASRTLHSWVLIFTLLFRSLSCKKCRKLSANVFEIFFILEGKKKENCSQHLQPNFSFFVYISILRGKVDHRQN